MTMEPDLARSPKRTDTWGKSGDWGQVQAPTAPTTLLWNMESHCPVGFA